MDFELNEDQRLIQETVARYVDDKLRDNNHHLVSGFQTSHWNHMAEMGWLAAGIPEQWGGLGGVIENTLIAEELGRGLMAGEFLGAAVLGPQLLIASGDDGACEKLISSIMDGTTVLAAALIEPGSRGDLEQVQTVASGNGHQFLISGEKVLVLCGDVAQKLIVSARIVASAGAEPELGLFIVEADAAGVQKTGTILVDGTTAANFRFKNAEANLLKGNRASIALRLMAEHGIACITAESIGMMSAATKITADYLASRKQFGVALSSFQVMQHKLADMVIEHEMALPVLHLVLAGFELEGEKIRRQRFSSAKYAIGESLRRVTGIAVQAHGGMGVTQEYPIGRYLQRMTVLDCVLGSPMENLIECAEIVSSLISRTSD